MDKIKLNLHEVSIPEKNWKNFRNVASEENMLILGVGVKYKLAKSRILSFICAVGLIAAFIACVVILTGDFIFSDAMIICAVCYVFCSFLCTKKIRRESTLSQITKCLNVEYKSYLQKLFVPSAFINVMDLIIYIIIFILTIPYQILMFVIGLIFPKFVISKNGVLVAIPKGYGLDGLEAIGNYYASISLFDEVMTSIHNQAHQYEVEVLNEQGIRIKLHSADNVHFYTDGGTEYINSGDDETFIPKQF